MKKIMNLMLVVPFITFGQWIQSGTDLDGITTNDQFGYSTSLSADGNVLAVGTPFQSSSSGQVRVFGNQSGDWVQIGNAIIGVTPNEQSGFSISLSDDGNTLAIGAPRNNSTGIFDTGQVRIYRKAQSPNWTQVGNGINGEAFGDEFGTSVSISGDGNRVAIGAPDAFSVPGVGSSYGQVRIYENQLRNWVQIGNSINGEAPNDKSGHSISLNQDGSIVAVGAPFNGEQGAVNGHVRVYRYQSNNWEQIGNDIDGEADGDRFGVSVSISNDGDIVAIGANNHNPAGHVRVYENQLGSWKQIGDDIDGEQSTDEFGRSVSLNGIGNIVAIGAPLNDGSSINTGHVRVYINQSGTWEQIENDIDGETNNDQSGHSVSISDSGNTVAIGARFNDSNGVSSGHVRVYANSATLSIKDSSFSNSFTIHPNPVNNNISLSLSKAHSFNLKIYDALGREVHTQSYKEVQAISINTSNYSQGLYHIKIVSKNKQATFKFVKE